ncbi:hypothetical protein EI427_01070 [Flammeovirga pectinis]|uniref:Nitrous oxide reductase n=1 Tax=Flammeovirga pectinis TaxID=2494373 RepID=A0A3Q9FN31_9BACT|nr:nitrous oxide reductase accessory protein NosL [Flammeovirga pectinis]AZQ60850.1 hypothetical protein EI427_01070 [Flammeovirga pectinis]
MRYIYTFCLTLMLLSCTVEPKEIVYGKDHCSYCDMTVVDKSHAAQVVSKKGRAYIFDSVECLVNKIKIENNENIFQYILVADYNHPSVLVDVHTSVFLITKNIKSPMGAFLSAFENQKEGQLAQKKFGGDLYSWNELKKHFSNLNK